VPRPAEAGRGEQSSSSENFEFVSSNLAPELKLNQTFTITLTKFNLQIKEKKPNLTSCLAACDGCLKHISMIH
jgi:hypothetical protein